MNERATGTWKAKQIEQVKVALRCVNEDLLVLQNTGFISPVRVCDNVIMQGKFKRGVTQCTVNDSSKLCVQLWRVLAL